jgi:hypothetical protein
VSAPDTNRPDTPPWFRTQQRQPPRPQCPVPPRDRPRCPAARPTAADPQPPHAVRRQRRARCACWSALVKWAGRHARPGTGCPDARTPDAARRTPEARTPRHCGHPRPRREGGHCGSGGAGSPAPEPSTTAAMSDRNGTAMFSTGQHPCRPPDSLAGDQVDGRRSRRVETVPLDRLDDQRDDQAAGWQSTTAGPVGPPAAEWPHPYHGTTRNRCAQRHFRRSRPTVEGKVIGSLPAKLCALLRAMR